MENMQAKTQGSLRISKDVIATIASCAATEIAGVAGLATYTTNIRNLFTKNAVNKSIAVELSDEVAEIAVHLNLHFGAKIPAVSEAVQRAVKEAVQNMTGITVSKVNVYIGDITFPQVAPPSAAAVRE
ncbi:MAG: Asp23/Gls24 family envelope stress response protein [Clostridiales bacterium]|uniref:Alkaline shock family protein YloU n=1 Tax=Harryflintia acetispora TaxID=1849041 RepID=A0A9X8Y8I3_9FIRM|nr:MULTISPECIES: Asp23/Gls24 family envelope stress response protein [Oscillospiraceae]PWM41004.1 MAG: Asp23/Gls24 family envelope stress response protein [Clostridiales bacterium]RGB66478.1 Asp23/Gls24 family envelope stress response protein [Harryflintia acetispora]TCL43535.1 putative alkaline shock family protein YloU [Harryflintia acetispora]